MNKDILKTDNNYSIKVYLYTNIYGNKIFILLVQLTFLCKNNYIQKIY